MTEGRDGSCGSKVGIGAPRATDGEVCAAQLVLGGSSLSGTAAGRWWCCYVEKEYHRQTDIGAILCRVGKDCR
jgi:hypothetical protein